MSDRWTNATHRVLMGGWIEHHAELARTLWDEGVMASEIARRVGHGATKNSIVGYAHRHSWPPRPSPIAINGIRPDAPAPRKAPRKHKKPKVAAKAPKQPKAPPPAKPVPASRQPPQEPRHRGCQWLESDRPHRFECTNPVVPGTCWCREHYDRVYVRKRTMEWAA